MDILAAILLFLAAFAGLFLLTYVSMGKPAPARLGRAHLALAVLGIVALIIYAFITPKPHEHLDTLGILAVAAVPGIWLLIRSRRRRPEPALAIIYAVLGMFGLLWLLTYVIPNT